MRSVAAEHRASSLGAEALLILVARVLGAASTSILTVVLASRLGSERFGVYALGLTIAATMGTFAELGIASALARFVAEAHPDRGRQRAIVRRGLTVKVGAGLVVALVMLAAAEPIAGLFGGHADQASVVRAAALAVLFSDLFGALSGLFVSLRFARANVIVNLTKSLVELGLVVALVATSGIGPLGAVLANAFGYGLGSLVGIALVARGTAGAAASSSATAAVDLLRYARLVWLANLPWVGFVTIDQLLLGAMLGPVAVGLYDAPLRINTLFQFVGMAAAAALAPRMVGGDAAVSRRPIFNRALRTTVAAYVALGLSIIPFADEAISVALGPSFARSSGVLIAILPYVALLGATPLMSMSLNMIGTRAAQIWVGLATLAVNLGLDLVLIPAIGVTGPAIATDIAFGLYFVGHLVLCDQTIGIDRRPLVRSVANGVLAGCGALIVGLLLDRLDLGDWQTLVIGVIPAGATAIAILVLRRELDRSLIALLRHRS